MFELLFDTVRTLTVGGVCTNNVESVIFVEWALLLPFFCFSTIYMHRTQVLTALILTLRLLAH